MRMTNSVEAGVAATPQPSPWLLLGVFLLAAVVVVAVVVQRVVAATRECGNTTAPGLKAAPVALAVGLAAGVAEHGWEWGLVAAAVMAVFAAAAGTVVWVVNRAATKREQLVADADGAR